ncbi:MAG: cell envelope integrity protein TolA [Gammaproteobacteria bacterium]|nr:cell envelope integrity protein TolA [Gammaproteobacteria bacterium]
MGERQENLHAFLAAAGVHLVILAPMVIALESTRQHADIMATAIPAVAISAEEFDRPRREAEAREKAEAARREKEREAARQRELQAQREADEQARRQREAEQQRQAEEAARLEAAADKQRRAEEEARRKAAEEQRRAEEAARRKAAEEKRQAEAEAARRRAEEEARLRAEREADMQAEIAAEQSRLAAIRAGKLDEWIAMMQQKAERYFSPPLNAGNDFYCEVAVRMIPGGDIASATTGTCDSEQLARAAEAAIWKAAPFPMPSDPSVFERNVTFIFDSPETE